VGHHRPRRPPTTTSDSGGSSDATAWRRSLATTTRSRARAIARIRKCSVASSRSSGESASPPRGNGERVWTASTVTSVSAARPTRSATFTACRVALGSVTSTTRLRNNCRFVDIAYRRLVHCRTPRIRKALGRSQELLDELIHLGLRQLQAVANPRLGDEIDGRRRLCFDLLAQLI